MIIYLDTSAALKLIIEEAESETLADQLMDAGNAGDALVASMLLFTELHCAVRRRATPPLPDAVNAVLRTVNLVDVQRNDVTMAVAMPGRLRSADAIHLATALRLGVDQLVAYDAELLEAAELSGLAISSPRPTPA